MSSGEQPASWRALFGERELWLLIVLTVAIYVPRLADQTIRGEESRWATVAQQMLASGDYLIPRQQGLAFPDRPPLHCWTIAACMAWLGPTSLIAIRLPSVLAIIATSTLIYIYGRRFLSPLGALASAVSFATAFQVMQLGRLAESDALFTLFVASSLLVWHMLWLTNRSRLLCWSVGFGLAAVAALAKGPQAPVYFVGITGCYLVLVCREWRWLVSWQYWVGAAVFLVVLGSWQVPFAMALGSKAIFDIWTQEGHLSYRCTPKELMSSMQHWLLYPAELIAATLPWSVMLFCYLSRWMRQSIGTAKPYVSFLTTALVLALPTCWIPANSVTRYFMSLFPCMALLSGLAIERSVMALKSRQAAGGAMNWAQLSWLRGMNAGVVLIGSFAVVAIVLPFVSIGLPAEVVPSIALATTTCVIAATTSVALWRLRRMDAASQRWSLLLIGGFCGFVYVGWGLNVAIRTSTNPAAAVAEVKQQLPDDVSLVSFGRVHHLFAFYYGTLIRQAPRLATEPEVADVDYFCFAQNRDEPVPIAIPFEWEQIAIVSCDRAQRPAPTDMVIVGRRKASDTTTQAAKPQASTTSVK